MTGRAAVSLLLLLTLCGCGSTLVPSQSSTSLAGSSTAAADHTHSAAPKPEMHLASGDKVRITVFGEEKLSGEFEIDPGGYLSLPLSGTIQAAGLTLPQLETEIGTRLKGTYLRNPKVTVAVSNFRPFYVLGEVQKPGEYQSSLNVLSAIAVAGGATYRANNNTVLIQRAGTTELAEYPQSPTVQIMPGDVVRVPERYF
jgi:protein involved in polysaccharide export with SLBB domain